MFEKMVFRMLCLVGLLLPLPAMAAERHALLIGNSRYEVATPLRNPENDIEIVGAALEKSGFAIRKASNATAEGMLAAVDAFVAQLSGVENPVVLVYFAGHGVQLAGENYLLPVDVEPGSEDALRAAALSLGELTRRLDAVESRLQVVVLDSCRDNPFEQTRGLARGLASAPERLGRIVAFSTSPGNVAADGDSGASPYAAALAESVTIPGLTIEGVFKRVRATVKERTAGKQEPWENSAVYGEFRFVEAEAASADVDEISFFEFASLADSQEAYQKYLARFPEGLFASLARQKIEFMDKDFSFRRQSETFRFVTFENDYEDRCGPLRFDKSDEQLRSSLASGEVVLLNFVFWFPYEACSATAYYELIEMGERGWVPNAVNIPERNIHAAYSAGMVPGDADAAAQYFGMPDAYFHLNNGRLGEDHLSLRLRRPDPAARENIVDIGCEDMCIYFEAPVRIHHSGGEAGQVYDIEFVNVADLGLTWKYQNTLRQRGEAKEQEIAALAEEDRQWLADTIASYDPVATAPFRRTRTVAGWEVAAILHDNGIFDNCRAIRRHDDRLFSLFRMNSSGFVTFGFFDPQGGFTEGSGQALRYRLDGVEISSGSRMQSPNEVAYSVGSTPQAMEALKAAREIGLPEGTASLAGSRAVLGELAACQAAFAAR